MFFTKRKSKQNLESSTAPARSPDAILAPEGYTPGATFDRIQKLAPEQRAVLHRLMELLMGKHGLPPDGVHTHYSNRASPQFRSPFGFKKFKY